MLSAAMDTIYRRDLRQHVPCVVSSNFTMIFTHEVVHDRLLHGVPFAKLVDRRRPIAVAKVFPYIIPIVPPITIDELASVQGLTHECMVEIDESTARKPLCCVTM